MPTFISQLISKDKRCFQKLLIFESEENTAPTPCTRENTQCLVSANIPPAALHHRLHSISQTINSYHLQFVILKTKSKSVRKNKDL